MSYLLPLLIMTITWSIGNILVKKSFARLSPWQTYAYDAIAIALPLWLIYGSLTGGNLLHTTAVAFASAFIISIVYMFYYYAIYKGPLGLTTPIIATYPVIAVILSFTLGGERLGIVATVGIILTIAGIIFISIPAKFKFKLEKWLFLSLLVSAGYGITAYTGKIAVGEVGNSTYLMILAITQVMVVILWKLLIRDKIPKFNIQTLGISGIGILLLNIGNIAYYIALEKGLASVVVPLSNSYIVLLVIMSVIVLKEKITRHQLFGIATVIIGVILINLPQDFKPAKSVKEISSDLQNLSISRTIPQREKAKVSFVIDGDTIVLSDKRKVRYIGINTPEIGRDKIPAECYAKESANINSQLVSGQEIEMEKDISEVDKYGRLLRYVWENNVFINEFLVRQGYAKLETIPPDTRYNLLFKSAEIEAHESGRGLWGKCGKS